MSEFSEVYYLKNNEQEKAADLLKKAGVDGYVYPARDGWVAFVANTRPLYTFSEKLKEANEGILLQFVNAEDHGWGFEVCVRSESVCSFYCGFNDSMDTDEIYQISRQIKEEGFEKLIQEDSGKFKVLRKYFDEHIKAEDISNVYDFTKDLELYFSEWISYHYAQLENGEFDKYGDYENLKLLRVEC